MIETQELMKVLNLINKYDFEKYERENGARLVLVTGADLFENKLAVSCYVEPEKVADVEKQLIVQLMKFEDKFRCVGQDLKDGSKKVGVMLLLPNLVRQDGKIVQKGHDLYPFDEGVRKLIEWARKEEK